MSGKSRQPPLSQEDVAIDENYSNPENLNIKEEMTTLSKAGGKAA